MNIATLMLLLEPNKNVTRSKASVKTCNALVTTAATITMAAKLATVYARIINARSRPVVLIVTAGTMMRSKKDVSTMYAKLLIALLMSTVHTKAKNSHARTIFASMSTAESTNTALLTKSVEAKKMEINAKKLTALDMLCAKPTTMTDTFARITLALKCHVDRINIAMAEIQTERTSAKTMNVKASSALLMITACIREATGCVVNMSVKKSDVERKMTARPMSSVTKTPTLARLSTAEVIKCVKTKLLKELSVLRTALRDTVFARRMNANTNNVELMLIAAKRKDATLIPIHAKLLLAMAIHIVS